MVLWLCGVLAVALSWYGAQKIKEVTAQRSNVSSKMFKTFMQHAMLLLQFWQIEALWRGKPGLRWRQRRSQASTQECWVHLCYTQSLRCQFGRWGNPDYGGVSNQVRDQLLNVQQVHATEVAFAAILADKSVVTWGGLGWQNPSQGSARECSADSCHSQSFCCSFGR